MPAAVSKSSQAATRASGASAVGALWSSYMSTTPAHLKLIDVYLLYLMYTGVLQVVYVVLAGSYPFNAFLAGFGSSVACFVFAVSLRMNCNPENKGAIIWNPQRAFAEFVVSHILLHFIVVHFMAPAPAGCLVTVNTLR